MERKLCACSDQMSMKCTRKKWRKGLFWISLLLQVRRLSQLSAISGIRFMAPELGPPCPSLREWHLQKLTGHHFRVNQTNSLHACGLFLTSLSDPAWTPEVSQGKLGSVCPGQTFCVLVFNFPVPKLCQLIPMRSNPGCFMALLA